MGNIKSVGNALNFIGSEYFIIEDEAGFKKADKLILPGVGAFGKAMENLSSRNLVNPLTEAVLTDKKPLLGLCLGMQLLFEDSCEHGFHKGLGFIKGHVLALADEVKNLPVPHMGWNNLRIARENEIFNQEEDNDFYFVHSFYCKCDKAENVLATVDYGVSADVMVKEGNIFGCQFHPEKSQQNGLELMRNFCSL
jgi:glutamine amidotransferase